MEAAKYNVLIGCEESQAVCIEFRKLGFNAFSCDIQECSGGHPEWHIKADIEKVINGSFQEHGQFWTEDDMPNPTVKWHCGIFFPPCTHLAVSGAAWFEEKRKDGRQQEGIDFFYKIVNCGMERFAIENPVGIMSRKYRKPDQIIQPYYFGDEAQKTTCLWLNNLPRLKHYSRVDLFNTEITHTGKGEMMNYTEKKTGKLKTMAKWYNDARSGNHGLNRSKTFPSIAKAMATQWGEYLLQINKCG